CDRRHSARARDALPATAGAWCFAPDVLASGCAPTPLISAPDMGCDPFPQRKSAPMHPREWLRTAALLCLTALLGGALMLGGSKDKTTTGPSVGTVRVAITDQPGLFKAVNIVVGQVSIRRAGV